MLNAEGLQHGLDRLQELEKKKKKQQHEISPTEIPGLKTERKKNRKKAIPTKYEINNIRRHECF